MQIIKGRTIEHSGLHVPGRSVNASQLERWLGRDTVEHLSKQMLTWYGPPIAVTGVPGAVYAHKGGDFRGTLRAGYEATAGDYIRDGLMRLIRGWRRAPMRQQLVMGVGFAGIADMVSEREHGKELVFPFNKIDGSDTSANSFSCWARGNLPVVANTPPSAPAGEAPTDETLGAFRFVNPIAGDTRHIVDASLTSTIAGSLLLYDRIFHVAKTMNSTATEAVTGVPTRYQSTTQGAQDSAEGNFLFVEVDQATAGVAHNWTTCLYEDQSGNAGQTLPSITGWPNAILGTLDHGSQNQQWFAPLAVGDTGIKDLEQMQCSALMTTGAINFVIGHPIAWMPVPLVNVVYKPDNRLLIKLTRIFNDAALALMSVSPPTSTSRTFTGTFTTADG